MKRVVVMQPYFFPYAGYFRLLAAADEFVIFDCVQWPRRGRVHRTQLPGPGGTPEWLTLPLAPAPRDTLISSLGFAPGARAEFDRRLRRYEWIETARGDTAGRIREYLHQPLDDVVDYLERGLRLVAAILKLDPVISRSSALRLDPGLRSQDRVIAVAEAVRATHYVNAPGGHDLYDASRFAESDIELSFLTPYEGPYVHMLRSLMHEPPQKIRADVLAATRTMASG